MDVILMPDQMMLQIHESIGHPLELDRILGDERNFAGTSFVTLDMFGHYRYGSELLNVTHDPTRPEQFASFAFDDDGARGERAVHHRARPPAARRSAASFRWRGRAPLRPDLQGVATTRAMQLEPRADRPHEQPQRRARRLDARRDDRLDRARRADAHQLLVEHRRLAQQVPVRLRIRRA